MSKYVYGISLDWKSRSPFKPPRLFRFIPVYFHLVSRSANFKNYANTMYRGAITLLVALPILSYFILHRPLAAMKDRELQYAVIPASEYYNNFFLEHKLYNQNKIYLFNNPIMQAYIEIRNGQFKRALDRLSNIINAGDTAKLAIPSDLWQRFELLTDQYDRRVLKRDNIDKIAAYNKIEAQYLADIVGHTHDRSHMTPINSVYSDYQKQIGRYIAIDTAIIPDNFTKFYTQFINSKKFVEMGQIIGSIMPETMDPSIVSECLLQINKPASELANPSFPSSFLPFMSMQSNKNA